jgi:hypothetical protein
MPILPMSCSSAAILLRSFSCDSISCRENACWAACARLIWVMRYRQDSHTSATKPDPTAARNHQVW